MYDNYNFLVSTAALHVWYTIACLSIAFSDRLYSLLVAVFVCGFCFGCYEGNKLVFTIKLWGLSSTSFIQMQSFLVGVGNVLGPAIAAPFLENTATNSSGKDFAYRPHYFMSSFSPAIQESRLWIPFSTIAILMGLSALLIIGIWAFDPETPDHPSRRPVGIESTQEAAQSWARWRRVVLVFHAIGVHFNFAVGLTMAQFLVEYVVKSRFHLSKETGAHMTTMYYVLYTVKNLVAILFIPYTGNGGNMILSSIGVIAGSVVLVFANQTNVLALWIGVGIVGFWAGAVYPSSIRYLEEFFPVTSSVGSITIIAVVAGEFTLPALVSFIIEDHPQYLVLITVACALISFASFLIEMLICNYKLKLTTQE